MNAVKHLDLIKELHACLVVDFNKVVRTFIRKVGWDVDQFTLILKKMHFQHIYHLCVSCEGSGIERFRHLELVMMLFYRIAKDIWLRPSKERTIPPNLYSVKRQIGGFFLTCFLYRNQPFLKKCFVQLTNEDVEEMINFNLNLKVIPDPYGRFTYQEILDMEFQLYHRGAFQFVISDLPYGIDKWKKEFIKVVTCPQYQAMKHMKEDELKLIHVDPILRMTAVTSEELAHDRLDAFKELVKTKSLKMSELRRLVDKYAPSDYKSILKLMTRPKIQLLQHIQTRLEQRGKVTQIYRLDRVILYRPKNKLRKRQIKKKTANWALTLNRTFERRRKKRRTYCAKIYAETINLPNPKTNGWRYLFNIPFGKVNTLPPVPEETPEEKEKRKEKAARKEREKKEKKEELEKIAKQVMKDVQLYGDAIKAKSNNQI